MSIEMGNPGAVGFGGYGNPPTTNLTSEPPHRQESQAKPDMHGAGHSPNAASQNGGEVRTNGGEHSASGHDDTPEDVGEPYNAILDYDPIPGFEVSASECLNRARLIAQSLNHTDLSADHLMLALTMEPGARRALERIGDVAQLREVAMQRLGRNYTKANIDGGSYIPTSDLADIAKKARQAAAEREQPVALSDLINAFPKANGRLTYAGGQTPTVEDLIGTIENGVVPRVSDAVTRIEAAVRDAIERQHQSVHSILEDLRASRREPQDWEQRQREFMDDMRRQVREAADTFSAALQELHSTFEMKFAELAAKRDEQPGHAEPTIDAPGGVSIAGTTPTGISGGGEIEADKPQRSSWGWLGLL